jgi:O-antigen/teichoic acid export membrane protein
VTNASLRGHIAHHGKSVALIGVVSGIGILASFAFQIMTARFLGPSDFGILAAFFAIINIAAMGSSSLQNAVTVQTARALRESARVVPKKKYLDGFMLEALYLGGAGAVLVIASSIWLDQSFNSSPVIPLVAATSIILSFVFARALGSIQGTGDSLGAVRWSTISLLLRVALVFVSFMFGLGLVGVLIAVLVGNLLSTWGALHKAQSLGLELQHKAFQRSGLVVLAISVVFATATNLDIIMVRAGAPADVAGTYAAAAVLVKAAFMVPATLSLYLLPRFVRQESNASLTRLGMRLTLALTLTASLGMLVVFALWGQGIGQLLYGSRYDFGQNLLVHLTLAYLPWMLAQGLLIRMIAMSSTTAFVLLGALLAVEVVLIWASLPNIDAMLASLACVGLVAAIGFYIIERRASQKSSRVAHGGESK